MTIFSDCDIGFSPHAPPNAVLAQFFEAPATTPLPVFLEQIVRYRPHPALHSIWVKAEQHGTCVGIATLYLPPIPAHNSAPAFIGNFAIQRDLRGNGLGRHLLEAVLEYCQQQQTHQAALEFTADSLGFWKAMGFKTQLQYPGLLFRSL